MSQYKYYFRKPRSAIVKDILSWLAVGGLICLAATSPFFILNIVKNFKKGNKYNNKKVYDAFYNLRRQGCVNIQKKNNQIYISLTNKGKERAGRYQIDNLRIKKMKKWDKKWRIVIFDIPEKKKVAREALRGKLKDLGFAKFQDSAWVTPFPCENEINFIKLVFDLSDFWLDVILTEDIGSKDRQFRKLFNLIPKV